MKKLLTYHIHSLSTKTFVLTLLSFIIFTSCESTLEEVPEDRLSTENYYTTEQDAIGAVTAIYAPMRDNLYYGSTYNALLESLADYANGRGSFESVSEYQGLDTQNTGRAGDVWRLAYQAIIRANIVIEQVPDIDMDEEKKNALVAEAYFLRAFNYFNLVRNFGAVPIRIEANASNIGAPRAPVDEVYELMINDFMLAEEDLPNTAEQAGRPSSWAAKTLLAEVYLTQENWVDASAKAKEVIDSGAYSLVRVTQPDDFNNVFGPEVITSTEEIFYMKYTRITGEGTQWPAYLHTKAAGYSADGYRVILGNLESGFFENWNDNDLRKEFDTYTSYVDEEGNVVELPAEEPLLFRKFRDAEAPAPSGHGNDIPILRYADALLIFAEAESESNGDPTPAAYDAINQVRRRAYGVDPLTPNAEADLTGLSATAFKDAVLQERAYEFVVEGKRYHDLRRTGRAQEAIEATGRSFDPKSLLFPIPEQEIQNNPDISPSDQNPGY